MPRAAGMVKSTASQQQDTMRDMKRPKSWTAGIWRRREERGSQGGAGMRGWPGPEPREPADSAAKGNQDPDRSLGQGEAQEDSRRQGLAPGHTKERKRGFLSVLQPPAQNSAWHRASARELPTRMTGVRHTPGDQAARQSGKGGKAATWREEGAWGLRAKGVLQNVSGTCAENRRQHADKPSVCETFTMISFQSPHNPHEESGAQRG